MHITVLFQTDCSLKDNNNAAQRLIDGMNFMAQSMSELSLGPTKAVTSWLTDQIAPAYWKPNSQILVPSTSIIICKYFLFFFTFVFSEELNECFTICLNAFITMYKTIDLTVVLFFSFQNCK